MLIEDTRNSPVETSLYYCNSRYYDPEIKRWISIDDIDYLDIETINGVNLYAYCMNNPVMCSDSNGHMPKWLGNVLTGIGIVVGTALFVAAIVASAGTVGALVGVGAAAIGLSTTAVSTAITVATISTYVVAGGDALFGASDATGNKTAYKQIVEHYSKHVIQEGQKSVANNIVNSSTEASKFFTENSSSDVALRQGVIKIAGAPGGIFNIDGLIRSFWYI